MKHLIKKISSVDSQICQVSIGDTDVSIVSKNGQVLGMIGGHSIINASKDADLMGTLSPIFAQILTKIHEAKAPQDRKLSFFKCAGYILNPSTHGFVDKVIYYLNKKIGKVVLEEKKQESVRILAKCNTIDIAMDSKALVANLEGYESQVKTLFRYLDRSADLSSILTRRKLISTMHGAEATQNILNSIRDNVAKLATEASNLPAWVNITSKSKQKLSHRLEKNLIDNDNERVYASTVLIPNITDHYDKIKNLAIKMATAISPLIYIDDVFKASTKFPATWFLPTNNIEDLNESYGVVLSFLLGVPGMESNLIDPLNFLRVKNLFNDKKK